MFDKTEVVNKTINASPFSPENLRMVKDKEGKTFVIQMESIISVEPYFDIKEQPDYCFVNMVDGKSIRVSLSPADLFEALKLPDSRNV